MLDTLAQYTKLMLAIDALTPKQRRESRRILCRTDLFFLMWFGLGRVDMWNQWTLDRCKEVQETPNSMLDLWARGHMKTSIITTGLTIQDILSSHGDNPDPKWNSEQVTIGIFSWKRAIAQSFLSQIKRELESNTVLKDLFPDILYENPDKDSPKWSSDGLIVKRSGNPKECTVEACGVVEGQPTGMHYSIRVYDDMVTIESVSTPDMQQKVVERWEMSLNLGNKTNIERYVGTRYHFADTYKTIMDRGVAKARIHTATVDGTITGTPVLMTQAELDKKRRDMGIWTFYTQMLLSPQSDTLMGFKYEWLKYYDSSDGAGMNRYIICDPANAKKKSSDYTVFEVVGLGSDNNYYTLELIRDRLNLLERTQKLFDLHRKWRPKGVGYEQYGMQADIQHIKDKQNRENYRFEVIELGGTMPKVDRIRKLVPVFEQRRWYMPRTCFKTDYEGKLKDLVDIFINEEYNAFPVSAHDDMLDCKARILDESLGALFPKAVVNDTDDYGSSSYRGSAWAS